MDQFLNCEICAEAYSKDRVPLVLQCGHTFCSFCISSIKSIRAVLRCPIDRICDPRPISEIKRNIVVSELVDYHIKEQENLCSLHESKHVKFICFDCQILFCTRCVNLHIFHKWAQFGNNFSQLVTQKKQILAEGKRKIEEKYEFLFNLQNLTLQKQQKMIQEVKEKFLVRKSQLRSEKDLWIDKILRDCNDEIGIYQNLCRVINECRAKINEMLEISAGTAEEIIIFESECNQIEETLKWIEAGSL